MAAVREIEGTEFDWFARDKNGNFAIFSTAGSGPVPHIVLASASEHESLGETFEIFGWGTPDVWSSYTSIGLFVYDWSSKDGHYALVGTPSKLPSSDLMSKLLSLSALPQIAIRFPETLSVSAERVQDGA